MGCVFNTPQKDPHPSIVQKRSRLSTIDCRRKSTMVIDAISQNAQLISEVLTASQVKFCIENLRTHHLFSGLSDEEINAVCSQMVWMEGKIQQYLFKQGQIGHSFFLIENGRVGVEIDGKKILEMNEGQCFGELALLFRASRAASIKCLDSDCKFFVMKPALYRSVLKQLRNVQYSYNMKVIQQISLFQVLSNKQKYNLAKSIKMAKFKEGEIIFNTGQISQCLFIVSQGVVEVSENGKLPIALGQYEIFGESCLRENKNKQSKVKCLLDTVCLVIGVKDLESSLGSNVKGLAFYNIQKWALLRSGAFAHYNSTEFNSIVMGFQIEHVQDNQILPGSDYKGLVISLEGEMNGLPEGSLFNLNQWKSGQQHGEKLVKSKAGSIGYLSFEKLNEIIRIIEDKQRLFRASERCIPDVDTNMHLNQFQIVRKLGQGQFGQVFLIKSKKTCGGLYAIKCISKAAVREEQMELSVIQQKKVLQKAVFPFIVGFVKAFHDSNNIFLLMEYIRGKQMFEVIREMPTLSKPIARYYFGCIMLAIQYLHANNIIYRDIKPQNSVVDHEGKVHLIDLGTAKQLCSQNMFKTFTIIGTPHYMAPEVFEGKGYSFEADYWSLGIILYEFVCGKLPFGQNHQGDPYALFSLIKKGKLEFPSYITDENIKKLVSYLLVKDAKIRSEQVTFDKIKRDQYFKGFRWDDLLQDKIIPPYIPRDFRSKMEESTKTSGIPFLQQLYNNKEIGSVQEWDENIGFTCN